DALFRDVERALGPEKTRANDAEDALMRALYAAYADRLAVRRAPGDRRGVMVGGRGVKLADESGVIDHDLFVCVDMDAGKRGERAEALVRQASAVERAWIDPNLLHTETHLIFD